MSETQKDTMSDFRTKLDALLDGYRDASYWKGYETAKTEWIRDIISRQVDKEKGD